MMLSPSARWSPRTFWRRALARFCTRYTRILEGKRVVVTRPSGQADELIERLGALGAAPIAFPAIEIRPLQTDASLPFTPNIIIFISANAVRFGLPLLDLSGGSKIAAVGPATAEVLRRAGREPDVVPLPPHTSESLLANQQLKRIRGQRILIVRGAGGREMLRDELQKRGAQVRYLECYQRVRPDRDASEELMQEDVPQFDIWVAASAESMANFLAMFQAGHRNSILRLPVIVVSDRMRRQAAASGYKNVISADGASSASIVQALAQWEPEEEGLSA